MKGRKAIAVFIALMMVIITVFPNMTEVYASETAKASSKMSSAEFNQMVIARGINVLEIQPGDSYKLDKAKLARVWQINADRIHLTQMPMTQFIADIDDINGKYDMVYIGAGNGVSKEIRGKKYIERYQKEIIPLKQGTELVKYPDDDSNFTESYSGIDITLLKTKQIKEMIDTGQMVILDEEIFTGKEITYLSDLEWTTATTGWGTIRKDRSVDNNTIRLRKNKRDVEYEKGIGTHANSTIKYDIAGWNYGRFTAAIGVDREMGSKGSVEFEVKVDGRSRYKSGKMTGSTEQKLISINLPNGAKKLELIVTDSRDGNGSDHADWADAKFHGGTIGGIDINTNMYKKFNNIGGKDNYIRIKDLAGANANEALTSIINKYKLNSVKKRPFIEVHSVPGADTANQLSLVLNAYNYNDANGNMESRVYLDVNGDGKYQQEERVKKLTNSSITNENEQAIILPIPEDFVGQLAWKLEVIDKEYSVKSYKTGTFEYKAESPQEIKILHITPDGGGTFSIKNDLNELFQDNKVKDSYIMNVEEIQMKKFLSWYTSEATVSKLNGKYDMIIFGFADMYPDVNNDEALNDIKKFIESGQSIMFTHDSMSFPANNGAGWSHKITKGFREMLGQFKYDKALKKDRYKYTNYLLAGFSGSNTTTKAKKINEGQITNYPFELGDISVSSTHFQYYKLNLEDEDIVVWYTLADGGYNWYDPMNAYYTYSKGNLTYCGTGHSNVGKDSSLAEKQLFVNTIVKAAKSANHAPIVNILQLAEGQLVHMDEPIKFGVVASDIDFFDETVSYEIWAYGDKKSKENAILIEQIGKMPVGQEKQDIIITEQQANQLADSGQELTILVKAFDEKKAMGEKALKVKRLNAPLQVTQVLNRPGYLLQDTGRLTVKLDNRANKPTDHSIMFMDIAMETFVKDTSIGKNETEKQVNINKDNEIFKPKIYNVKFEALNQSEIKTDLQYKVKNAEQTSEKYTSYEDAAKTNIDIKKSKLTVNVKDMNNRPIKDVNVKVGNSEYRTNLAGIVYLEGILPTGTYDIEVMVPGGYSLEESPTKTINMAYSATEPSEYEKEVEFKLQGSPIRNVQLKLKDLDTREEVDHVTVQEDTTEVEAVLKFKNLINLTYEEFPIIPESGFDYELKAAGGLGDFCIENNRLIYRAKSANNYLAAGNYEIPFVIKLSNSVNLQQQDFIVNRVTIQEYEQGIERFTYSTSPTKVTISFDNKPPTIIPEYNSKGWIEKNVGVDVLARVDGTGSNLVEIKWLNGTKSIEDFRGITGNNILQRNNELSNISIYTNSPDIWKAKDITKSGFYVEWISFNVKENRAYTIYAKDAAGHEAVEVIYINNIYKGELPDIS